MGVVDRARSQLPPFLDAYLPAAAESAWPSATG
jgi:hypothetical protein